MRRELQVGGACAPAAALAVCRPGRFVPNLCIVEANRAAANTNGRKGRKQVARPYIHFDISIKNAASVLRPRLNHFATIICPCRSPSANNPLATSRNACRSQTGCPCRARPPCLKKLSLTAIAMWLGSLPLITQSLHRAARPTPFSFH